ncbi:hypothetical protein M7I_3368 [Glarea lozoyensis 74030]|nr:hypothetical protein M7I_3368 [Glarea lozoyensis 74030]
MPLLGPLLSLIYGVTVNLSILPVNTKAIGIGCTGVLGSGGSCGKQTAVCCMSRATAQASHQDPALISILNGPINVLQVSCPVVAGGLLGA